MSAAGDVKDAELGHCHLTVTRALFPAVICAACHWRNAESHLRPQIFSSSVPGVIEKRPTSVSGHFRNHAADMGRAESGRGMRPCN